MENNNEISKELLEKTIIVEVENQRQKIAGRPTVFTKVALSKLKQAFLLGCSDKEACFYADISRPAFYRYSKENLEFRDEKERLKTNLTIIARIAIMKGLSNPRIALRYLEKKLPEEFGLRQKARINAKPEPIPLITDAEFEEILKIYTENHKNQIGGEKN